MEGNTGKVAIRKLISAPNETNAYVLINGDEAALIDAPDAYGQVKQILDQAGATLKYLLVTHGHESHIHSLAAFREQMGGMVCLHELECEFLQERGHKIEPDLLVRDKTSLKLKDVVILALHTPGHTKGSLCFYVRSANALFSGDTLLKGEFGKIWGPHSMGLMLRSLKRLNNIIPPKTSVYPGHGSTTTMSQEAWLDALDNLS